MPEPSWMRFRLHKTPHLVEFGAQATTHRLQLRLFFFRFFDDGGGTHLEHARRIANAAGVHRHIEDRLFDPGCVTGVRVIQQKRALFAGVVLSAIALLPFARRALSDDIGPLAVWAMQDLPNPTATLL